MLLYALKLVSGKGKPPAIRAEFAKKYYLYDRLV